MVSQAGNLTDIKMGPPLPAHPLLVVIVHARVVEELLVRHLAVILPTLAALWMHGCRILIIRVKVAVIVCSRLHILAALLAWLAVG